ncbi:MAG: hypothetical protein K1X88_25810, partial [Nannocystaceae bacterium]|nr:hypothetical protein [Nannocystaceae bacterium]
GERAVPSADAAEPAVAAPASASPTAPPVTAAPAPEAASASATPTARESSDGARSQRQRSRTFPRLQLAAHVLAGPHAFGNEECRSEQVRCEAHGTFFGLGVGAELRARLYRPLYLHVRGLFVGNVSPRDPIYRGLGGGGLGLGAYGRRVFGRAEYLLVGAIGDNHFTRPFGSGEVGTDRWGHHAGLFSAGARLPVRPRLSAELWGGLMVGPKSVRTLPDEPAERRVLLTFLIGLGVAYDLVPDRKR